MRFILAIFVLIPLAVAALGTFLVLLLMLDQGVAGGLVAALLIFGSLTTILAYMAFRILRRPQLELAPGVTAPPLINSLTVGMVVAQTAGMVALAFALKLGTFSVKNWIGPICLVLGLVPLFSGSWLLLSTRYRIRRRDKLPLVEIENLRVAIAAGNKASRILVSSSLLAVTFVVIAYYLLDGARYFSLPDVGGVAFLIVCTSVVQILDNFRFRMIHDYAQEYLSSSVPS
jgi:hypothetical protein